MGVASEPPEYLGAWHVSECVYVVRASLITEEQRHAFLQSNETWSIRVWKNTIMLQSLITNIIMVGGVSNLKVLKTGQKYHKNWDKGQAPDLNNYIRENSFSDSMGSLSLMAINYSFFVFVLIFHSFTAVLITHRYIWHHQVRVCFFFFFSEVVSVFTLCRNSFASIPPMCYLKFIVSKDKFDLPPHEYLSLSHNFKQDVFFPHVSNHFKRKRRKSNVSF